MINIANRRVIYDAIRASALFLVVIVHTAGPQNLKNNLIASAVFFVGKLGVPLFVMLSGALLLPKYETLEIFYKKRINKIILPWFFWSIVYLFYKNLVGILAFSSISNTLKEFIIVMLSDFWFMPMIVGIYVVTPYLRKVVRSNISLLYLFIFWFTIFSLLPLLYLSSLFPGTSSAGLAYIISGFSGYFLLGWYINEYGIHKLSTKMLFGCGAAGLIISLFFSTIYSDNLLFFLIHDYLSPPILIASAALFALLLKTEKKIISLLPARIYSNLSLYSYGIFLCHVLITHLLSQLLPGLFTATAGPTVLMWLIRAVLVYSSSAALISLGAHIPYLKKIVY